MPLLKNINGEFSPAVEEPLIEAPLAAWLENPAAHADATALVLEGDDDVRLMGRDAQGFSVVVLNFPSFMDGRAYSQARLLRDRFGYEGEIRARGDVLRDQVFNMVRCGIDGLETRDLDAAGANAALAEFSFAYQRAACSREPVWRRRQSNAKAA